MTPRRVLIAPDSFKGTASAGEVAESIAAGWRQRHPDDEVRCLPMADGGEGTLDAFAASQSAARRMPVTVLGPDDRPVEAHWLLLSDGTGVVELAATSGITLLGELRPLDAHTRGFGQAIRAALETGVNRLILAIGGSSSTDGGAGLLRELGARLLDAGGEPVQDGNRGLAEVATVDLSDLATLPEAGAVVLSDVTSPLLGALGCVAVFGPQKGMDAALAPIAEQNLARFARLIAGVDPGTPGAGAAGGAGFGLLAWGAQLTSGAAAVGEMLGLPALTKDVDVVITGEGRFDEQSSSGKVPGYVRDQARAAGALAYLAVGEVKSEASGFQAAVSLTELAGSARAAMADPSRWLTEAGRRLAEASSAP